MYTNNYGNKQNDKAIAKIKWCSVFASQCICDLHNTNWRTVSQVSRSIEQIITFDIGCTSL